ncbi:MAG: hypothetical protein WCF65_06395 [Parachlamydiaceae bacterium]
MMTLRNTPVSAGYGGVTAAVMIGSIVLLENPELLERVGRMLVTAVATVAAGVLGTVIADATTDYGFNVHRRAVKLLLPLSVMLAVCINQVAPHLISDSMAMKVTRIAVSCGMAAWVTSSFPGQVKDVKDISVAGVMCGSLVGTVALGVIHQHTYFSLESSAVAMMAAMMGRVRLLSTNIHVELIRLLASQKDREAVFSRTKEDIILSAFTGVVAGLAILNIRGLTSLFGCAFWADDAAVT